MVRVMAFGTFDLVHPGHIRYLKMAKKLGTELIVVIARDDSVKRIKGKKALFNESERLELISSLKFVDKAVLGHDFVKDKSQIVGEHWPDVIALGYDQKPSNEQLRKELLLKINWQGKIVRLKPKKHEEYKTSRIKKLLEI